MNRNSAIHLEIIDPDAPDAKEPITDVYSLADRFLIFKPNGVYQGHLPEEIDKENSAPETKPTYTKIYSVGSNNPYLARGFLQFIQLTDFSSNKEQVLDHLWETTRYLLNCEDALYYIYKETLQRLPECDKKIEESKNKGFIPLFPTVPALDEYIARFFLNAKHCLINIFKIFHIVLQVSDYGSKFDKYLAWFQQRKEQYPEIYAMLKDDLPWINDVRALRNAIEHPGDGQSVEIRNITLLPGNKFSTPGWRYDLSRSKGRKQDFFSDVIMDINTILNNVLSFQEAVAILCLNQALKDEKKPVRIYKREEATESSRDAFIISFAENKNIKN